VSFGFPGDSFAVFVILFGVSSAGKTTLGQLLADELGWKVYEGDDFHSQTNVDKMHAGAPLTD
jgi:gluconokinase